MWYAPIGSIEYIRNLHNDIRIRDYILSEHRFASYKSNALYKLKDLDLENNKTPISVVNDLKTTKNTNSSNLNVNKKNKNLKDKIINKNNNNNLIGKPISIRTSSRVLVQINRSFKKTNIRVVSYTYN